MSDNFISYSYYQLLRATFNVSLCLSTCWRVTGLCIENDVICRIIGNISSSDISIAHHHLRYDEAQQQHIRYGHVSLLFVEVIIIWNSIDEYNTVRDAADAGIAEYYYYFNVYAILFISTPFFFYICDKNSLSNGECAEQVCLPISCPYVMYLHLNNRPTTYAIMKEKRKTTKKPNSK